MAAEVQSVKTDAHDDWEARTLTVTGRVTKPLVLSMEELCGIENEGLDDLPIFCGSGTPKGTIAGLRGVHLDKVIGKADVLKEEHNDTKKMIIVASARDGHKVVFSWQEIFNSPVGGGAMVLTERDGKSLCEEDGCLELISAEDYFTGSRYVKGLVNIEIRLIG
ncbi:MAG: hypothetical protein LLG06_14765 [Desulfobacteraceae bacterium]|nr:hypothetical protein [Desulfobacteraceae bacterium]